METERFVIDEEKGLENIQLVSFRLGEELYAIDVLKIEEIIRFADITAVPRRENFVLGVMNLRGKIIPVVDLRIRFNLDKFDFDKDTCIVVVNFDGEYIGFVVDSVVEVMRVNKKMINPNPPLVGTIGQEYILGICRYKDDLVFILDIDRVVFVGNKYKDSYLKKLIQGSVDEEKGTTEKRQSHESDINLEDKLSSKEVKSKQIEVHKAEDVKTRDMYKGEDASLKENSVKIEEKEEKTAIKEEKQEDDVADIDKLIMEELIQKKKRKDNVKTNERDVKEDEVTVNPPEEESETNDSNKSIDELMQQETEKKEEKAAIKEEKQEDDVADIDKLIMEELKKREKETEELIQKKKRKDNVKTNERNVKEDEVTVNPPEEESETNDSNKSIDELMQQETEEKEKKKKIVQDEQESENIDLDELKRISKSIIEGGNENVDREISTEIASIVAELKNAKDKYEGFINTLVSTHRTFPKIEKHLDDINEITLKSTDKLFNVIDGFNHFYEELLIEIDNMKRYADEGNMDEMLEKINYYESCISEYADLALSVYEALEFEDITSQKINNVLKLVSDITARFGSILGYIKNGKKTDYVLLSQEDINNILKNMGLE